MAAQKPELTGETVSTSTNRPGSERQEPYTGVILIHGLGDIKRNTMLQQVLNSLSYWYNHVTEFALQRDGQPEGAGCMWIETQPTDDPSPDAPPGKAWVDLAVPPVRSGDAARDATVHLEFREVWWAASFGIPPVSTTLRWARLQAGQQVRHLLIPEIWGDPTALAPKTGREKALHPLLRVLLEGALFLYSIIQYSWKAVQWLVITPLALFLLLIMGLVKLLVSLVPFLRSSVVASFSTFFSYVMMHWVAEVQVYLLDYTRSSAVRGRFDKEFKHFFDDAKCDRIVVIAESGGTMVAYEGLTTLLEPWKNPKKSWPKPVTFITVSQALRRVWLLDIDDSGRLHGVLPKGVRWVNFWARYDPIAAGPLPARSLPPRQRARTKEAGDSDADKERITNVAVHNTDNTFTDHTGYWDNLEQVIAVIALELVQGHPTLVEVVEKHQATGDDILLRRASVAWRAMVTLFGGLAAGSGIIAWNLTHNYDISIVIKKCFQPKGACSVLLGDLFTGQPVSPLLSLSTSFLQNPVGVVIGFFEGLGTLLTRHLDVVIMIVSALVVAGGVMLLLAQVIAAPSPFNFKARTASRGGPQLVLALAVVALACFIVAFLLPTDLQPARLYLPGAGSHMLTEVGVLVTAGAWILALLDALRIRRWGWLVAIVAISLLGGITGIGVGGLFLLCILGSVLLYGLTAGGG